MKRDPEQFRNLVFETISGHRNGWIVDGTYGGVLGGDLLQRADTLIWLELPFQHVLWRILKRTVQRATDKRKVCGDNTETWRHSFLNRKSLLLWYLTNRLPRWTRITKRRARLIDALGGHCTVIRLGSVDQLNAFYEANGLPRP